jgi:hypothetical protein
LDDDDDDENERGTLRVIPSARLDPCVCDGGRCADIEVEAEVAEAAAAVADVDKDVDLPCRASGSVIGTANAADADTDAPFRTSFTAGGSGVGTGCESLRVSEGRDSGPGVDLGGAEPDVRLESYLGLCAGAGAGLGAGTGRSGIGVEERTGVGEGGSIRFWECLVLSVARGGKSCVPFCGRMETGGLIPSLPGAGTLAAAPAPAVVVLVPLCMCTSTSFLYFAAVSLDCDSNIMGRLE